MSFGDAERVDLQSRPGRRAGVTVLTVKGPLTIQNFFDFQEAARRNSPVTIIDLGGVPFLDSAALGCLVGVHVSCERSGRKYAIVRTPERIQTMFSMTGISDFLVVYPTVEDAEAALAS